MSDFRDKLIMLVIESAVLQHILVSIGFKAPVLVGDVRINFNTTSDVAGSRHVKRNVLSEGGIYVFCPS